MNDFEKRLMDSWDSNSHAWTESIRKEKIESRNKVTNPAIFHEVLAHSPQRVLDIGCGEGWLARKLAQEGIQVVGIDGSKTLIEEASKAGGGTFKTLTYEAFATDPAQLESKFDVVLCNFSLLSEDIQPVLKAAREVLAENGTVIIQTLHPITVIQNEPYENGWKIENFDGMGERYVSSMPWYYRTLGSWINEFNYAGLNIVDCKEPINEVGVPLSILFSLKR
ncbi:class I SAM-dependent methyltransferase [Thalassobacillus hwangdonensis]|uniref:Class I SAM-dependent methyltransferase n=1 Tax=Thalassobacillus hwangdonensis TaxID=546108 RepID=A0ABW3KZH7_9BACI